MELGLALPQYGFSVPGERPLRWNTVVDWAQAAEAAGWSSVWLSDHLTFSLERYGGASEPEQLFEPLTALAALARATERVRLGTLVLCAPLRPPAIVAKIAASLDVISGGRTIIGLGAGWHRPDFDEARIPYPAIGARLERLEESVIVVDRILRGGSVDHTGVHVQVSGARADPGPVQRPRPPIWVGGHGERLIALAARVADGWNTGSVITPDEYRDRLRVFDRACEAAGRDPSTLDRSIYTYALVGTDEADLARRFERLRNTAPPGVLDRFTLEEWRRGRLVGTVDQVREQIAEWKDLGVTTLVAFLGAVPFSVTEPDDLQLLASARN